MGQCCQGAKLDGGTNTDGSPRKKLSLAAFTKSTSNKSKRGKSKSDKTHSPKHHPLPDHQSSGSQTPNNPNNIATFGQPSNNYSDNLNEDEYDEEDEEIDLSAFQEEVVDFIEFWHHHFEYLSKESIHNALVRRVHNKVKEQYESFPREAVDEFIKTLPELLETLETLVNMAIDGEITDAMSMYKEFQPILMNGGTLRGMDGGSAFSSAQPSPMPREPVNGKKGRHRKQDSFSIKLTPAYIDENYPQISDTSGKLPVPPSPSRSKSKSKSNSKSPDDMPMTDKDGIDIDDVNIDPPRTPEREQRVTFKDFKDFKGTVKREGNESPKQTQIVVTKPKEMDTLSPNRKNNQSQIPIESNSPSKSHSTTANYAQQHNIITNNSSHSNDQPNAIILGNINEEDEQQQAANMKIPDVATTPVKNKQVNFSQSPKQRSVPFSSSARSRLNKHRHSNSLNIDHLVKSGDPTHPPRSPSPDPIADEEAYTLFMGTMNGAQSYDEDEDNVAETAKMLNNKSHTHSSGHISLDPDSDDEEQHDHSDTNPTKDVIKKQNTNTSMSGDKRKQRNYRKHSNNSKEKSENSATVKINKNKTNGPSFRKLPQSEDDGDYGKDNNKEHENDEESDEETIVEGESLDAPQPLYDRAPDSFRFELETTDDAEVILVGIMRTLWFDRVQKHVTKAGMDQSIDDLFFILSNSLETAIGTFREYKVMMESFSLYIRQGLRTTVELMRAIINDLPLTDVQDRTEMYDDPYSILIHFADRCDVACEFWNAHISTLNHEIKIQLSMRVYSYAIMNVPQETYDKLKQKGAIVRWSTLLLDFMETIIRFFTRNRHQDLMEYLLILALHHEKMKIPSTLLGNMGEWLDEVFSTQFDEDTYNIECSDAIQFVYAFVGEVMSGAYEKPIYDTISLQNKQKNKENDAHNDMADEINENIDFDVGTFSQCPAHLQKDNSVFSPTKTGAGGPLSGSHTKQSHHLNQMSGEFQIPTSFKSVVQIPMHGYNEEEDLTVHHGHFYGDSNYTLPKPQSLLGDNDGKGPSHFAQPSYTFGNLPKQGYLYPASTTLGPKQGGHHLVSNLDLDSHPSLTDMFVKDYRDASSLNDKSGHKLLAKPSPTQQSVVSAIQVVEHSLVHSQDSPNQDDPDRPRGFHPSLRNNMSAPPRQYDYHDEKDMEEDQPRRGSLAGMKNLRPPSMGISTGTTANGKISMYVANSPLSQLESPSISPQPMFQQPGLTPNAQSYDHDDQTMERTPATQISVSDMESDIYPPTTDGGRAVTMLQLHTATAQKMKQHKATTPTYSSKSTLNVVALRDELEKQKHVQINAPYKRPSRRQKKRSFSHADNQVVKFLAPGSQHNYTNTREQSKKSKKKHNRLMLQRVPSKSRTSSKMLLDKQQERNWKPMHFLQKIMDLEGRKIISNYAFAPSDGSLSEKIVDLSIFHPYFEQAEQFWSRYVDINDKTRNKINDKLLNVFSQRITDQVRDKVSELFAQKQINFVQMFSLYFKLVRQYLVKCKNVINGGTVNPALLDASLPQLPPNMTPSFKHAPHSSNMKPGGHGVHKRTYSQRNSMSLGLSKFKLRSETSRGDPNGNKQSGSGANHNNHFHNEGQFFVREMLRIGRKHRSHHIQEKTLKLVAKCLIEVIEKQFAKRFNDKTKRAFTIALKLGIKFMCVEPTKNDGKYYYSKDKSNDSLNNQKSKPSTKQKSKKDKSSNKDKDKDKKEKKKKKSKNTSKSFMRAQSAQVYTQSYHGGGFVD